MVNEWTREDLPSLTDVLGGFSPEEREQGAIEYLGAALDHLNANHPKSDTDRWRRAHEIVERERDQARQERDEWERRYLDTAGSLTHWHGRWVEVGRERDEAVARAEAAEARTAPAVTRQGIEGVIDHWIKQGGNHEALLDDLWRWVSGADPVVHVVRESDVAAVEVKRASDGWYADGAWLASADETAEWVRDRAAEVVVYAARNEAVARAIEAGQAADPVESKARELYEHVYDGAFEYGSSGVQAEYRKIAAHVLGQEDRHVDQ